MGSINKEVDLLLQECSNFLEILNEINSGNFDEKFIILQNKSKLIQNKKDFLNKSFDVSELKKFNIKFDPIIKQINESFDSKLKNIKTEQQEVSLKLKESFNKKKLANYR